MTLTEVGEEFLIAVRATLDALDAGVESARRAQDEVTGGLRLGLFVSAALELMGPILRLFEQRYPRVTVEMETFNYDDPSCGLRSNRTDIAFVRTPFECPGLRTMRLFVEPRAVAVNSKHRLAKAKSVSAADLANEPVIAARTADATWRRFWTLRDTEREETELPKISRTAGSAAAELDSVEAGIALTITPYSFARYYPRPSVVYKRITDVPGSEVALAWCGSGAAITSAFLDVAKEVLNVEHELVARIEAGDAGGW